MAAAMSSASAAELAKNVNADTLELFAYLALHVEDATSSIQYVKQFQQTSGSVLSAGVDQGYGRLYIYNELLGLVTTLHLSMSAENDLRVRRAVEDSDVDSTSNAGTNSTSSGKTKIPPFREWRTDQWNDALNTIHNIYSGLKRKDATAKVGDEPDSTINIDLIDNTDASGGFGDDEKKFDHVSRYYEVHRVMSPYRHQLNRLIADAYQRNIANRPLHVANEYLDQLLDDIDSVSDETVQKFLRNLVVNNKLKSAREIKDFFQGKAFSFKRMYAKTLELFRLCTVAALGRPVLYGVYIDSSAIRGNVDQTTTERDNRALEKLVRSRRKLEEQTEDQLNEIIAVAKRAKRQSFGKLNETSRDTDRDDDDDDDDEDQKVDRKKARKNEESHGSTQHSKRRTLLSTKQSALQIESDDSRKVGHGSDDDDVLSEPGPLPQSDDVVVHSQPLAGKKSQQKKYIGRKSWTELEKNAIKEGARRFGVGSWAKIKECHADVLDMRTSTQIKDCWRTMLKKEDLEVLAIIEEESRGEGRAGQEHPQDNQQEERQDDGQEPQRQRQQDSQSSAIIEE